jgi:DNA-binding MarR family transcriptional regulator
MKLTEKSAEVFNYVNGNGGRVSLEELCEATGRTTRSVSANVNDLVKKGLAVREKVAGQGEDAKEITFVVKTPDADAILAAPDEE